MNLASLELCKELYGLSDWSDTNFWYGEPKNLEPQLIFRADKQIPNEMIWAGDRFTPAYDLGYLLRKLPARIHMLEGDDVFLVIEKFDPHPLDEPRYTAMYKASVDSDCWAQTTDTPEDAVCALAIKFFQEEILKKEPQ